MANQSLSDSAQGEDGMEDVLTQAFEPVLLRIVEENIMASSRLVPLLQKLVGIWEQRGCLSQPTLRRMQDTLQVLESAPEADSALPMSSAQGAAPAAPQDADSAQQWQPPTAGESPLSQLPDTLWQPSAPSSTGASGDAHAASTLLGLLSPPAQAEAQCLASVLAAQGAEASAHVTSSSCSAEMQAALAQTRRYLLQKGLQHSDGGAGGGAAGVDIPYDVDTVEAALLNAQAKLKQHEQAAESLAELLEIAIGELSQDASCVPASALPAALRVAQSWEELKGELSVVKGGAALQRLMASDAACVLEPKASPDGAAVPLYAVTRLLAASVRAKWHGVVEPAFQEAEQAAAEAAKAEQKRAEQAVAAAAARGEVPARLKALGVVAMGPGVSLSRVVALVPLARTPPLPEATYSSNPLGLPAPPPMIHAAPQMMGGGGYGGGAPPMMGGGYGAQHPPSLQAPVYGRGAQPTGHQDSHMHGGSLMGPPPSYVAPPQQYGGGGGHAAGQQWGGYKRGR